MGEALEVSDSAILMRTTSTPSTPTSDKEISGVGDSRTPSGGQSDDTSTPSTPTQSKSQQGEPL